MVKTILQRMAIRMALDKILSSIPNAVILGEDIGVYGGAFGVTTGLQKKFGDSKVIDTPITEQTLMGLATGLSISGFKPILEIMFMDFSTLILDQLLNQTVKLSGMYDNQVTTPLMIRTPAGGYRGYGPTHSQSLENIFLSIPELTIVYPYSCQDYYSQLLWWYQNMQSAILFIENKELYLKKGEIDEEQIYQSKVHRFDFGNATTNLVITYGYTTDLAIKAFTDNNKNGTILSLTNLKPLILEFDDFERYENIVIAGEPSTCGSVQEHIATSIYSKYFSKLKNRLKVIGSKDTFIPARIDYEKEVLISDTNIALELI